MKKIILFILPFIIATLLFIGLVFFINQKTGKGALQVTATPQSEVFLDGKSIGETPVCKCEGENLLPVGDHSLRIVPKNKSLSAYEEKIVINNGTLTVIDKTFGEDASASNITLESINEKDTAQIMVITSPDSSDVYLDGNLEGKSPLLVKSVTQSDHELRISKEGYIEKTIRVKATKGYVLNAVIYLGVVSSSSESAIPNFDVSPTPTISKSSKVLILDTPTGFLRVRSSSSTSTSEVGRVNPGETYEIIEEEDGWYKIKLQTGVEGWITAQYAEKQ